MGVGLPPPPPCLGPIPCSSQEGLISLCEVENYIKKVLYQNMLFLDFTKSHEDITQWQIEVK